MDVGKVFEKIQHTFLIKKKKKKNTQPTRKRRKQLNKSYICKKKKKKPTANIILSGERLKVFPTRSGWFLV